MEESVRKGARIDLERLLELPCGVAVVAEDRRDGQVLGPVEEREEIAGADRRGAQQQERREDPAAHGASS